MRYMLLIYGNEQAGMQMTETEQNQEIADYWAYTNEISQSGVRESGEALMPTTTATTVRVRDGKTITTDGPFAETKEQLGGFYLLNCKDLDEAIGWAAKIPGARKGSIEVRPIVEWNT
jgi:hypothetical protein